MPRLRNTSSDSGFSFADPGSNVMAFSVTLGCAAAVVCGGAAVDGTPRDLGAPGTSGAACTSGEAAEEGRGDAVPMGRVPNGRPRDFSWRPISCGLVASVAS